MRLVNQTELPNGIVVPTEPDMAGKRLQNETESITMYICTN